LKLDKLFLEVQTDIQTLLGGLGEVDIKMPLQDVNGGVEEIYSLLNSHFSWPTFPLID